MIKISTRKKMIVGLTLYLPSSAKVLIYKLFGAYIGENVRIGLGSYIFAEKITLRDGVGIGNNVNIVCKEIFVDEDALIAGDVTIGGESICRIGKRCYIGPRAYIDAAEPVILEDDVGMGGDIYTHGVWPPYTEGYPRKFAPVVIKRSAWVPPSTTILPGVTIGEEAMIGTGAVVTKSIPRRTFAVGVPAVGIKSVDEIQTKLTLDEKDARVKEIIGEFKEWIRDDVTVEDNVKKAGIEFTFVACKKSFMKTRKWALYCTGEDVTSGIIQQLLSLRGIFTKILIVSVKGFSQEILTQLVQNPELDSFFEWVDLEKLSCKRSQDDFFHLLRSFLRSYYGVRLKSEKCD